MQHHPFPVQHLVLQVIVSEPFTSQRPLDIPYFPDSKMHLFFWNTLHKILMHFIVQVCVSMTCKATEIPMRTKGIMVVIT